MHPAFRLLVSILIDLGMIIHHKHKYVVVVVTAITVKVLLYWITYLSPSVLSVSDVFILVSHAVLRVSPLLAKNSFSNTLPPISL